MLAFVAEMAATEVEITRVAFLEKHKDVVRFLKQDHSIRNAAKISEKGAATVQKVKKLMQDTSQAVDYNRFKKSPIQHVTHKTAFSKNLRNLRKTFSLPDLCSDWPLFQQHKLECLCIEDLV
jgi:hypothetical protein